MIKIASKFLLIGLLSTTTTVFAEDIKFEMGLGVPYGMFGGNASVSLFDNTEVFAGLGVALGAVDTGYKKEIATGLGYSAGGRFYVNDNIRLTAGYGVIGGVVTGTASNLNLEEVVDAFAGIGYKSGSKNQGFSFDVLYLSSSNIEDKAEELGAKGYKVSGKEDISNIKIALGYRF